MTYNPQPSDAVGLVLGGAYLPLDGNRVGLAFEDAAGAGDAGFTNAPIGLAFGQYGGKAESTTVLAGAFGSPPPSHTNLDANSQQAHTVAASKDVRWSGHRPAMTATIASWDRPEIKQHRTAARWFSLVQKSHAINSQWDVQVAEQLPVSSPWRHPPPRELTTGSSFNGGVDTAVSRSLAYRHPGGHHVDDLMPWGQSSGRIPTIHKPPGVFDPPAPTNPAPPAYIPPIADGVGLGFFCPPRGASISFRAIPCLERSVNVINSAELYRAEDGLPIPGTTSIQLALDIDSWAWRFGASVAPEARSLFPPGERVELIARINGLEFRVFAEKFRKGVAFGRHTMEIRGRSVSSELSEPGALAGSRDEQTTLSAFQLANQELAGKGWALSAHPAFTDWIVPAGAWSYRNLSPINAVEKIAESVGAVILPAPDRRQLTIVPRYPVAPWQWSAAPADKELSMGVAISISSDSQCNARFNGVFVAGEKAIISRVFRGGTSGAPYAEMVVDPLITDPIAARQRGVAVLAASGNREIDTVATPLLAGEGQPGLYLPGDLVGVLEDADAIYKALCIGVSLEAQWGAQGLAVQQAVTLERYTDG